MKMLTVYAATAATQEVKISCPSFETVKQEVERIMREQHLTFRGALMLVKRDHRFRDLAECLGFGASEFKRGLVTRWE